MRKPAQIRKEKQEKVKMEAALKNYNEDWPDCGKNDVSPRLDATFTEIYELIFYNNTMVGSELSALLQLLEKKYKENNRRDVFQRMR